MARSPCATCRDPGYCCRALMLSTVFPADMPREQVYQHNADGSSPWPGGPTAEPTPQMRPIKIATRYASRGERKPHGVTWLFSCDWLGRDGRCKNYRKRPDLCKSFKPKSDRLCIEYEGSYRGALRLYRED